MFTCFREHSFTFIPCPGQIVDNIVLIHQIEVISISIKRQAAARLELENTNVVFLMCIFWISFHDLALAILLNDIVNEAQWILKQLHSLISDIVSQCVIISIHALLHQLLVFINWVVRILNVLQDGGPQHLGSYELVGHLLPKVGVVILVLFPAHAALNHRFGHKIIGLDKVIVKISARFEYSKLHILILVELVNKQQIQSIIKFWFALDIACYIQEMWTWLNTQVAWEETNIIKLLELYKAFKPLVFRKVKNQCFTIILIILLIWRRSPFLLNIIYHDFRITKIVCHEWIIATLLFKGVCLSLNNRIITRYSTNVVGGNVGLQKCILLPVHWDRLINVNECIHLEVLLGLAPNIVVRENVVDANTELLGFARVLCSFVLALLYDVAHLFTWAIFIC